MTPFPAAPALTPAPASAAGGRLLIALVAAVCACVFSAVACDSKPPGGPTPNGPTVAAVTPNSGTTLGGTTVTITGSKFDGSAVVIIGGAPATDVAVQSASSITAKTAQHASGAADVTVSVNGQAAALRGGFTFVAPAATSNAPPVISSVKAQGTRRNEPESFADLGEEIAVTVYVTDEETPLDQLAYEWTASGGTFSGRGPVVRWRAPDTGTQDYDLTSTVIERYQATDANGLPATQEHRVTSTVRVSVHSSEKEVGEMAGLFLDEFSHSSIPADTTVRNFTDSCPGKREELAQVRDNRDTRIIDTYSIGTPRVTINFGGVCSYESRGGDACVSVAVDWRSRIKATGKPEHSYGTGYLTAVYQGSRWWLCDSNYQGTTTSGLVFHK